MIHFLYEINKIEYHWDVGTVIFNNFNWILTCNSFIWTIKLNWYFTACALVLAAFIRLMQELKTAIENKIGNDSQFKWTKIHFFNWVSYQLCVSIMCWLVNKCIAQLSLKTAAPRQTLWALTPGQHQFKCELWANYVAGPGLICVTMCINGTWLFRAISLIIN